MLIWLKAMGLGMVLTLLSVTPERRLRPGWRWGPTPDPQNRDSAALSSSGVCDTHSPCSTRSQPRRRRKSRKLTPDDTPVRWSRLTPRGLQSLCSPPRTRDRLPHWRDPSSLLQRPPPKDSMLRHPRLPPPDDPTRISTPWTKVPVIWRSAELVVAPPCWLLLPWPSAWTRTTRRAKVAFSPFYMRKLCNLDEVADTRHHIPLPHSGRRLEHERYRGSAWICPWTPSWTKVRDLLHPGTGARLTSGALQHVRCWRGASARSQQQLTSLTLTSRPHAPCTLAVSDGPQPCPADNTCATPLRHLYNNCSASLTSQVRVQPPCAPMGIRQRSTAGALFGHNGDGKVALECWVLGCPREGTLPKPKATRPFAKSAPSPPPPSHSRPSTQTTPLPALAHRLGSHPACILTAREFSQPCFVSSGLSPLRHNLHLPTRGVQQISPCRPNLERRDTAACSNTFSPPWTRRASTRDLDPAMARGKRLLRRHRPRDTARQRTRPPQQVRHRQQDGEGPETILSSSSSEPAAASAQAEGGDRSDQAARRNSTRPLTVFSVSSPMRPTMPARRAQEDDTEGATSGMPAASDPAVFRSSALRQEMAPDEFMAMASLLGRDYAAASSVRRTDALPVRSSSSSSTVQPSEVRQPRFAYVTAPVASGQAPKPKPRPKAPAPKAKADTAVTTGGNTGREYLLLTPKVRARDREQVDMTMGTPAKIRRRTWPAGAPPPAPRTIRRQQWRGQRLDQAAAERPKPCRLRGSSRFQTWTRASLHRM